MVKSVGVLGLILTAVYLARGGDAAELAQMIEDMLTAAWNGIAQVGASLPAPTPGSTK